MADITRFDGIVIKMFKPSILDTAYFYALYGDRMGKFYIHSHGMRHGDLPEDVEYKVMVWCGEHEKELLEMWETEKFHELPPLSPDADVSLDYD